MKCRDCGGELDEFDVAFKLNACESCRILRQKEGRCRDCGGPNAHQRSNAVSLLCDDCSRKWDEMPDFDPKCPTCGSSLEMDKEAGFQLWCPKCLERKGDLVPV